MNKLQHQKAKCRTSDQRTHSARLPSVNQMESLLPLIQQLTIGGELDIQDHFKRKQRNACLKHSLLHALPLFCGRNLLS